MAQFDVVVVGLGAMGSAALHRAGAARRPRPRHRALDARARPRLLARREPHHPARLFRASVLCAAAAPGLCAVARARSRGRGEAAAHHRHRRDRPAGRRAGERHARGVAAARPAARGAWTRPRPCGASRRSKFPTIIVGVFQPDGGFIAAEAAIATMLAQARAGGRGDPNRASRCAVRDAAWRRRPRRDQRTAMIDARTAIVAAGPWLNKLLPDLPAPLRVTRQVMGWFEPRDPAPFAGRTVSRCSCSKAAHGMHYGFPPCRGGRAEDRQASPPRRDGRSRTTSTAPFRPTTKR